ncbi:hypothetical protein [Kitasatospora sp. NPDC093679]|uniref:hypothetical protein n=1 Tax=Kitasatospora sp. NPDC093679 TaxID=3154983 RepID=UPI003436FCF6
MALEAGGQRTAVAGCAANETALGGGYAVDGAGYATTSEFVGSSAWLAAAYNPGSAPVTLTVYALCVNAPVEFAPRGGYTRRALAFRDRVDKVTAGADGRIHDLTTDGPWAGLAGSALGTDTCVPGFTMTGMEFRADRAVTGHGAAPLPLERLAPLDGSGTGPGGPVTLGTGGSGRFTVPLLADGDYTLDFAATDPDSGLVAHARTTVRIAGCLR